MSAFTAAHTGTVDQSIRLEAFKNLALLELREHGIPVTSVTSLTIAATCQVEDGRLFEVSACLGSGHFMVEEQQQQHHHHHHDHHQQEPLGESQQQHVSGQHSAAPARDSVPQKKGKYQKQSTELAQLQAAEPVGSLGPQSTTHRNQAASDVALAAGADTSVACSQHQQSRAHALLLGAFGGWCTAERSTEHHLTASSMAADCHNQAKRQDPLMSQPMVKLHAAAGVGASAAAETAAVAPIADVRRTDADSILGALSPATDRTVVPSTLTGDTSSSYMCRISSKTHKKSQRSRAIKELYLQTPEMKQCNAQAAYVCRGAPKRLEAVAAGLQHASCLQDVYQVLEQHCSSSMCMKVKDLHAAR